MEKVKIALTGDAQEFLFYSYFGESWAALKNDKEKAKKVCFRRAYRDFCRTLSFTNEKEENFCESLYTKKPLSNKLDDILKSCSQDDFDKKHENICSNEIIGHANSVKGLKFYYGQAQKWLNMTLKYMYMTGLWENEFSNMEEYLHIPLDNYILRGVFNETTRKKITETETELFSDEAKNCNYVYSDGSFKPNDKTDSQKRVTWSRINSYDYLKIQKKIKECIPDGDYKKHPLIWENKVWMAVAKLEK